MHDIKTKALGFFPIQLGEERFMLHYTYYSFLWLEEQTGQDIAAIGNASVGQMKQTALLVTAGLLEEGFDDYVTVAKLMPMNAEDLQAIIEQCNKAVEAAQTKKKPVRQAKKPTGTG